MAIWLSKPPGKYPVQFTIQRFARPGSWMDKDTGMLKYHFIASEPEKNLLELRFCILGRMYCRQYNEINRHCKKQASVNCNEMAGGIDVLRFVFSSTLLSQFVKSRIGSAE